MNINYDNIHQAIAALNQCAKENENRQTDTGAVRVSDLCTDVAYFLCKVRQDHKKYSELEQQHEEDELWMQQTREEIKFWTEFWRYITDEAIGDKQRIIDAVANNDHNWFEGYVEVTKSINDKQELLIKFKSSKGQEYTATWQPSDNYACWQTCGIAGDDYSGFLLFPTYKDNRYFCIYYMC